MLPYVMVRFSLSGDKIPLHDIAQKIGIPPARIRKKEDWPRPSILAGVAKDMLEFRTDKEECRAVSTQLGKIQAMLTPKIETIREVMQKYSMKANLTVVIESEINDYPELVLTMENIEFLSAIHAEIGFDLYIDEESYL